MYIYDIVILKLKWILTEQDHLALAEAPGCPGGDDILRGFILSVTASAPDHTNYV